MICLDCKLEMIKIRSNKYQCGQCCDIVEASSAYKEVCDLFNEVLEDLRKEYTGSNFESGNFRAGKDGLTERQRKKLHDYRVRLRNIHIN